MSNLTGISALLGEFVEFLRADPPTQEVTVLTPAWSPTYGQGDPREETLTVVEFDALLKAIDAFGETLRGRENPK